MAIVEIISAPPQIRSNKARNLVRRLLLTWRSTPSFRWAEAIALTIFFLIAAYTLRYHEPWDDEAQAWLIARDNSLWQILRYRLHYEGTPPTWHLLLHLFHAVGGTYTGMGWLGILLATAGIYVWLRWSPFPALVRFLLPYTFFLQYQYAVIARSYVLFPLLTFLLCVLYTKRQKVLWFALVAGLLANLSLQGFMEVIALTGLYLFDAYEAGAFKKTQCSCGQAADKSCPSRNRYLTAGVLLAAMMCTAIYCAIPAPDLDFAIGNQVSTGTVHHILVQLIGETPRDAPKPAPDKPILGPMVKWIPPQWNKEPRAWLAIMIYPRTPPANHYAIRWIFRTIGPNLLDFFDAAAWPLANSNFLAFGFLIAVVLWLRARLRLLWPWLALMATGQILWTAEHHAGMLLIALVAGLWLAANTRTAPATAAPIEKLFLGLFAAILLLQIAWTAYCVRSEVKGSYDPGPETAQWLKQNAKPRMAAFGFATVSIQPWFSHSPFFDVPASWWQWSSNVEVDGVHREIVASHPDLVVYGLEFSGRGEIRDQWLPLTHISADEEHDLPRDPIVKDLHDHGYRETHRFCGTRFARFSSAYRICDMVFEPVPDSNP